jgi:hypothetical protein
MTNRVIRLIILTAAFALITIVVGWWAVALVAVLWGWLAGTDIRYPRVLGAAAAGLAWLGILASSALSEEGKALLATVSGLFSVPGALVVIATVGIGVLLGFLGSWLGAQLRPHPAATIEEAA